MTPAPHGGGQTNPFRILPLADTGNWAAICRGSNARSSGLSADAAPSTCCLPQACGCEPARCRPCRRRCRLIAIRSVSWPRRRTAHRRRPGRRRAEAWSLSVCAWRPQANSPPGASTPGRRGSGCGGVLPQAGRLGLDHLRQHQRRRATPSSSSLLGSARLRCRAARRQSCRSGPSPAPVRSARWSSDRSPPCRYRRRPWPAGRRFR
jgi:hypothetical protein